MVRQNFRGVLQCLVVLVPLVVLSTLVLQKYSDQLKGHLDRALSSDIELNMSDQGAEASSTHGEGACHMKPQCSNDHFSFYVKSGAANVMAPKICFQNKVLLGTMMNNAGVGINIVIVNGKTGEVLKTGHFDMYGGEVQPLVDFLKDIEQGSIALVASFDEPASKLNDEAKQLMEELGSTAIRSLTFRDNWVFVGGKGATVKSNFEKYLKNDASKNKYDGWPELIEVSGCIPKYME